MIVAGMMRIARITRRGWTTAVFTALPERGTTWCIAGALLVRGTVNP